MKPFKSVFAIIMAIVCAAAFSSCSDEDNPTPEAIAKTIQGSYEGDMDCTVMGVASIFENVTFTVKATDESTVTVVLPPFGEAPMDMPSITLAGVKVSEANGRVTMAATEVSGTTDAGKRYTCTVEGTVEGSMLDIRFNLQYGAMPMPLICSSKAVKK